MRWDRLPQGMCRSGGTWSQATFEVLLLADAAGYVDRCCPECKRSFKVRPGTLPTGDLTCPYCGHDAEVSWFHTAAQTERAVEAARQAAVASVEAEIAKMLRGLSGSRFKVTASRSARSFRPLPAALGAEARREVKCTRCGCEAAVYGADGYCAGCGPHSPRDRVLSELASRRDALDAFAAMRDVERHALEDAGAIDRARDDLLKTAGTVFETYLKHVFALRVPDHVAVLQPEPKTAFQQQGRAARLYRDHLTLDLTALATPERWGRLGVMLAKRHVLTHNAGTIDEHYLRQVPASSLRVGQRLVIDNATARTAAEDVEAFVVAVDDAINATVDGSTAN